MTPKNNKFVQFIPGRKKYLFARYKNALPVWRMEIKKRQVTNLRVPIPTDVKKAVWKRDGGKVLIAVLNWNCNMTT